MTCVITFVLDIKKKLQILKELLFLLIFFYEKQMWVKWESFDFNNYLRTAICESFEVNIHSNIIWKRCGHYSDVWCRWYYIDE